MSGKDFKGGYQVNLLEKIDDRYICPYCNLLLRTPVQTSCGHRLCTPCQYDLVQTRISAPTEVDKPVHRKTFYYGKADWDGFYQFLWDVPWDLVFSKSASDAAAEFTEWLRIGIDTVECEFLSLSGGGAFKCPACGAMVNGKAIYPDKFAGREIASFRTKCRNSRCPWVGRVADFEDHVQTCSFAESKCPNEGCTEYVLKDKMKQHLESECQYRRVECPKCKEMIPVIEITTKHTEVCPKERVDCPNSCGKTALLREVLSAHLKECPNAECSCPYRFAGCAFVGRRQLLNAHLQEEIMEHAKMAADECSALKARLFLIDEKYSATFQSVTKLTERLKAFEEKRHETTAKIELLSSEKEKLVKDVNSLKTSLVEVQRMMEKAGPSRKDQYETELDKLKIKAEEVEKRTKKLEEDLSEETEVSDTSSSASRSPFSMLSLASFLEPTQIPVERRLDGIDKQLAMQDVQVAELHLKLQLLEVTSYNGTLIWKVDNIERRRADAVRGKTPSLYSPPFYVGRFGYKACARIYLNGDGIGKGKCISLFFTLMRGEYDALLPWPFQQKVTFKLLDLKNCRHITETFRPDPYSSSFRRPVSDMNLASGCPQFADQRVVFADDSSYVDKNTMFLEVSVDTAGLKLEC